MEGMQNHSLFKQDIPELGGQIKLVNVNKIFNWSFKVAFLKNCLNEQKRRGETSCWSCHFEATEVRIWNNKIETYKTFTWQLYSMYSSKGNILTNTVEEDMLRKSKIVFLLLSLPCAYHSKIMLDISSCSFHDCFL